MKNTLLSFIAFSIFSFLSIATLTTVYAHHGVDHTAPQKIAQDSPFAPDRINTTEQNGRELEIQNQEMVQKCRAEGAESPECQRFITFAFENIQTRLLEMLDDLDNRINGLVDRALEQGTITQEEGDELKASIDAFVDEYQISIEGADTLEDLRGLLATLKSDPRYINLLNQLASTRMSNRINAVDAIVAKLEGFVTRVESHIQNLNNEGIDTSEAETSLNAAKTKIQQAKDLLAANENTSFVASKEAFTEIRGLLHGAQQDLRTAAAVLKNLYQENDVDRPATSAEEEGN